jgi:tRNA pseudouridine38-40 synthase
MRNIKLTIEYDGSGYHGWQSQENATAISDIITDAIKKITGENVKLIGSGRTDVGVHAYSQIANFKTESKIPVQNIYKALNGVLPKDITVLSSIEVSSEFNARFSAKGKRYRYLIYNSECRPSIMRNRACHVRTLLDVDAMLKAAQYFLGTHDFSAFKSTGSSVISNERTINLSTIKKEDNIITFETGGSGYLYNMVRIMAGTLIEVGRHNLKPEAIIKIIEGKDRKKAGKTAPAHALYLVEVYY